MLRHIVFNIHIPKCAGSSFVTILKRNFGYGFGDGRSFLSDASFKYSKKHIAEILTHFPRLTCFSDHKLTINLPYEENSLDIQAIAFVRNPVERLLSHYFYCRSNSINNFDALAKKLALEEYIEQIISDRSRQDLINGQMYHLTGVNSDRDMTLINELVKSRRLLLFTVSRFDEACVMLEKLFPQMFRNCAYLRKNVSHKDQKITQDLKQKISRCMNFDFQLLQIANLQMNEISNELFISESDKENSIIDFNHRCYKLAKYTNNPWRLIKRSGLRVAKYLLDDPQQMKVFIN